MTSYAGSHNGAEAPIAANNNGVLFLNSAVRFEDITDGASLTIFVGEKLNDGLGEGWASGTRASLRNAGSGINRKTTPTSLLAGPDNEDEGVDTAGAKAAVSDFDKLSFVGGYDSRHPGGANFAFGDGSVRFVRSGVFGVLRLLANRADGEFISSDRF